MMLVASPGPLRNQKIKGHGRRISAQGSVSHCTHRLFFFMKITFYLWIKKVIDEDNIYS